MAAQTENETNGCNFQWKIKNISHCWLKKGKPIKSPTFIADALDGTKWSLWLYPQGFKEPNYVGFYLSREEDCSGPNNFEVSYQLAFLDKNGSFLREKTISKFSLWKGNQWGFHKYVKREKVFLAERESFLPGDTLTVLCKLWNKQEKQFKPKTLYAQTVFKENRRYFFWRIDKFSTLNHDVKNKFRDSLIDFDVVLNKELCLEKTMTINIKMFSQSIRYFSLKSSIVDFEGKKLNCGFHDYLADDLKKGSLYPQLFTKKLTRNKNRNLSIDALILSFEYVTSTKAGFYECFDPNIVNPDLKIEVTESKNEDLTEKEKCFLTTKLANDLQFMFNDAIFSDMELRTTTRTFRAHKNILSARSPVFRNMFSNDMKEKNTGHVNITDFEEDTVHRMLMYMYTDTVGDMHLESAIKLYSLADKYQILSLKSICSSFLKDNLCSSKACDILVLSDLHNDANLKSSVQDYIVGQHKEFFSSQEWDHFMHNHIQLAADVMYRKIHLV